MEHKIPQANFARRRGGAGTNPDKGDMPIGRCGDNQRAYIKGSRAFVRVCSAVYIGEQICAADQGEDIAQVVVGI